MTRAIDRLHTNVTELNDIAITHKTVDVDFNICAQDITNTECIAKMHKLPLFTGVCMHDKHRTCTLLQDLCSGVMIGVGVGIDDRR